MVKRMSRRNHSDSRQPSRNRHADFTQPSGFGSRRGARTSSKRSSGRPRLGLCLLVFILGGGGVFSVGYHKFNNGQSPQYSAQAGVSYLVPSLPASPGKPNAFRPDLAAAQRQITSEANLRQTLDRLAANRGEPGSSTLRTLGVRLNDVQRQLRVSGELVDDQPQISIACSGSNPQQLLPFVNQLADQYAVAERARFEADAASRYRAAQQATQHARQVLGQTTTRLEEHLKRQREAERAATQVAPPQPETPPPPKMVDNPEFTKLDQELTALNRRRTDLLVDRTPLHPAVQAVDNQIAQLREAIRAVPRQIPESGGASSAPEAASPKLVEQAPQEPSAGSLGQVLPSTTGLDQAEAARKLAALQSNVDRAARDLERIGRLEREASEQRSACVQVQVHPAKACQVLASSSPNWVVLSLASACAGLVLATGIGLVSIGYRRDLPVRSLEEVQALLPVPILGVVGRRKSSRGKKKDQPAVPSSDIISMSYGLILIAVCVFVLTAAFIQA
jgi:hypothetical protein